MLITVEINQGEDGSLGVGNMVIAGRTWRIRKSTLPSGTNLSRAHLSACLLLLLPLIATATVLTAGASISSISPAASSISISPSLS